MTSGRVTEWIGQRVRYNGHGRCIHGVSLEGQCDMCPEAWKRSNYPSRIRRRTYD